MSEEALYVYEKGNYYFPRFIQQIRMIFGDIRELN